ncbi:MAG: thiamine pyrophosphate-dependent dehydrogenase E1 component subunit alpha [Thermoplasmatota archaeon]
MSDVLSILSETGELRKEAAPVLRDEEQRSMYAAMLKARLVDERMLLLQRQGRIGFYGSSTGEEAAVIGSAYALSKDDWIFPALRQGGALLMRGWPLRKFFANLFGTNEDVSLGRSMPCHYSDKEFNVVTWSSSMATQLPHAVGMAYAAKVRGDPAIAMGYMGDGATSESDFHAAMNFAGVWKVPVVFVCHNNQWAISVPFGKQTASDGIAVKAQAYGFAGVRVDGNDILAVYKASKEATDRARRGDGPTLIEAVTYRMLGHSSSDDPTRYRDLTEVEMWARKDPIERYRIYLGKSGIMDAESEKVLRAKLLQEIETELKAAEAASPPDSRTLVETVYRTVPPHLEAEWAAYLESRTTHLAARDS